MARMLAKPVLHAVRAVQPRARGWSLATWPWADEPPEDPRPGARATERMYWRHSGRLAYPPGTTYPLEVSHALVGEAEHMAALRGQGTRASHSEPEPDQPEEPPQPQQQAIPVAVPKERPSPPKVEGPFLRTRRRGPKLEDL